MDEIIGMKDMEAIFSVTDALGIDREQVSVPLGKEDPGQVTYTPSGDVEIVVPLSTPITDWLETLRASLTDLGFTPQESDEDDWAG